MKALYQKFFICLATLTLFSASVWSYDYFEAGKKAFYNRDYFSAKDYFKNAIIVDPKNPNYHYFYAQTLIHLNNIDEALREYRKIIDFSPYSEAARLSLIGINKVQEYRINQTKLTYFENKDNKSQILFNNIAVGDSYIENALDKGLVTRWNVGSRPISINFEEPTNLKLYKKEFYTMAKMAFDKWIEASDGSIKYVICKDKKTANIKVSFVDSIGKSKEHQGTTTFISGLATHHKKNNILEYIDVQLSIKKPNGNSFTAQEIYNTALHEFGHSFGILGHSINKNDIMYAVTEDESNFINQDLSKRDKNTLILLYKLEPDVSNFTAAELLALKNKKNNGVNSVLLGNEDVRLANKLKEAQNYVKQVPYIPISWTSLGDAYKNLKRNTEAIDSYKKALSLDAGYAEARQALADLYLAQDNKALAILEYQELIKSEPKNIMYSYNLALIYYKNSQNFEAQNIITVLRSKNPEAEKNEQVMYLMQKLGMN